MTTIKVSSTVRDRLNEEARRGGVPVNSILETLLAEHSRRLRFEQMREAFAATSADDRASYEDETADAARLEAPWPKK
ncbi:MAG TPA: hypothetical protein VFM62_03210 [Arthrobacter sp.]|nr:hypothetical protein [Arthrobacter sp.]